MPRPETPAQMPIARPRSSAGNTLVRIDRVAGMMNAPPMPARARKAMSWPAVPAKADATDPTPKIDQAEAQRSLATEAVAEAAGGQQDAGVDDRVGVDDPLELAGAGVQVALDGRAGPR